MATKVPDDSHTALVRSSEDDAPLFRATMAERYRALLRSRGMPDRVLRSRSDQDVLDYALVDFMSLEAVKRYRAELPRWIAAGYVSEAEAQTLRSEQLRDLGLQIDLYESELAKSDGSRPIARPQPALTSPDLTRGEVVALLAQTISVIAAQQAEIDELRDQVATLKNANLAVFGEHKVIEQLTTAPRDFEGVEVTMRLQEYSATSLEHANDHSDARSESKARIGDASAALEGLASMLAGMNLGGAVDLKEANETVKRMRERSKARSRVASKGEVKIKIAKVSRA